MVHLLMHGAIFKFLLNFARAIQIKRGLVLLSFNGAMEAIFDLAGSFSLDNIIIR